MPSLSGLSGLSSCMLKHSSANVLRSRDLIAAKAPPELDMQAGAKAAFNIRSSPVEATAKKLRQIQEKTHFPNQIVLTFRSTTDGTVPVSSIS